MNVWADSKNKLTQCNGRADYSGLIFIKTNVNLNPFHQQKYRFILNITPSKGQRSDGLNEHEKSVIIMQISTLQKPLKS